MYVRGRDEPSDRQARRFNRYEGFKLSVTVADVVSLFGEKKLLKTGATKLITARPFVLRMSRKNAHMDRNADEEESAKVHELRLSEPVSKSGSSVKRCYQYA